jgi:LRR receptor-like serine/threonine-protein kinase FLS2
MALPATIGNTLPSLAALGLHNNMFQGQIPASPGNASSLTILDFTFNNFSGYVPSSLGKLLSLQYLKQACSK